MRNGRWTAALALCLFLLAGSAQANEVVYFVMDKSGSMWAQGGPENKAVFERAKERAFGIMDGLGLPNDNLNVFIVLFDSKLPSDYIARVRSVDEAMKFLAKFRPKGRTTIGDTLEYVRKEIEKQEYDPVTIHLFSDLDENNPKIVPFDEAAERLSSTLGQLEKNDGKWNLHVYTWKNLPDNVPPFFITDGNEDKVIITRLDQKDLQFNIDKPDPVFAGIDQSPGGKMAIRYTDTRFAGFAAPELWDRNVEVTIIGSLPDFPGATVLIDGGREFQLSSATKGGKFEISNVKIEVENLERYLTPDILGRKDKEYALFFDQSFSPSLESQFGADMHLLIADPPKTALIIQSEPAFVIKNYPEGEKIHITHKFENEDISEPLELLWNKAAIGKTLVWDLPRAGSSVGYIADASGRQLSFIDLDKSLRTMVTFNMRKIQALGSGELKLWLQDQDKARTKTIPTIIEPRKPFVAVDSDDSEIELYEGATETFEERFDILPVGFEKDEKLRLAFAGCTGDGCRGLELEVFDPVNPQAALKLGGSPLELGLSGPYYFDCKVAAGSPGKAEIRLVAASDNGSIKETDGFSDRMVIPLVVVANAKEKLVAEIQPPGSLLFELTEQDGGLSGAQAASASFSGTIDPRLIAQGHWISLEGAVKGAPGVHVLFDGKPVLDLKAFADENSGEIRASEVPVSLENLAGFFSSEGQSVLTKSFGLMLRPRLNPTPKPADKFEIVAPGPTTIPVNFHLAPSLKAYEHPSGNSFVKAQDLYAGERFSTDLILEWNLGAAGKELTWTALQSREVRGYISASDNREAPLEQPVVLDESLSMRLAFNVAQTRDVSGQSVRFALQDTDVFAELPVTLTVKEVRLRPKHVKSVRETLLTGKKTIERGLVLEIDGVRGRLPVQIELKTSKGGASGDIQFALRDAKDSNWVLKAGDPPKSIQLDAAKEFFYEIEGSEGRTNVDIVATLPDSALYVKPENKGPLTMPVGIEITKPQVQWAVVSKEDNDEFWGDAPDNAILFTSRGQDVTTDDEGLLEHYDVRVPTNIPSEHASGFKVRVRLESETSENLISRAIFNATGNSECTLEEFKKAPHVTLDVDPEKKPFIGTKKDHGRIVVDFPSNSALKPVVLHYRLRLRP